MKQRTLQAAKPGLVTHKCYKVR